MLPLRALVIRCWIGVACLWASGGAGALGAAADGAGTPAWPVLTRVADLLTTGRFDHAVPCDLNLEADVWWVDAAADQLVLHDASGAAGVELDLAGAPPPRAGTRARVTGRGTVVKTAHGFRLGVIGPVVDNDGIHAMLEKSGQVWLDVGRQPLRVDWFNGIKEYGLQVEYAGPGVVRQPLAGPRLLQPSGPDGNGPARPGVDYSIYNVDGEELPDFASLTPVAAGVAAGFDPKPLPHPEHVGMEFRGRLEVEQAGFYTFYTRSDDGSRLYAGVPSVRLEAAGAGKFPTPQTVLAGQSLGGEEWRWARVEGRVTFANAEPGGWTLELRSGNNRMTVRLADGESRKPSGWAGRRIRATGVCQSARTTDGQTVADRLLVAGDSAIETLDAGGAAGEDEEGGGNNPLPTLTTAAAVHRLKREAAGRGYPVRLSGVVTCVLPEHQAFTLQDDTRGIYVVDLSGSRAFLPEIGESLEVTGATDPSLFAPIVNARGLRSLGAGALPTPVTPTRDQLLNGSLDGQYVELQGVITAVNATNVVLFTRDGRLNLDLRGAGLRPDALAAAENARVRVRGCLFANWDYVTHEVTPGQLRIYAASLSVSQPAPADLFALPSQTVADLMRFDPQASVLQRVKVSGQILHVRGRECFLTDGRNALRVQARQAVTAQPGDLVAAAGFPEWSGAAPMLVEAELRRTGRADLPPPQDLTAEQAGQAEEDARLVRVRGVLVSARKTPAEWILEVQQGVRTFAARLDAAAGLAEAPPAGSRLELTGVCANLGAGRTGGPGISAFELLLNSPADLRVLARPPWLTLRRLLFIVGALGCGLAFTGLWITQLHRQVEQRTAELGEQIRQRQQVEQQRALEQERARMAQDLHDELGSSLTEISMLSARASARATTRERREEYLGQMHAKAGDMVTALEEIVWAISPRHDSLASLVSYFCLYADRFLGLAGIAWRLEPDPAPEDLAVDSRRRHQLFLVFKEALTNVVRHSGATEVRLGLQRGQDELRFTVADNGRGMPSTPPPDAGSDGVANMRARLEKLGGRLEITSHHGQGTRLRFILPLRPGSTSS